MTLRLLLPLLALTLWSPFAQAQRIAFVNTKYILDQMPEYRAAQQELDRASSQWQKEIDERYDMIKRMRDAFNAEAILLTEEMKRARMAEIEEREREARDLQKKRFGPKGDLFKRRQELIQPIQDRIYQAIKEVAGTTYVAIFDIGGVGNNVLFASEKYDKSDSVLRKLGIKPGKTTDDGGGTRGGAEEDDDEQPAPPQRDGGGTAPPRGGENVKPR
ncbi:MAG: OmpH family outer membrane protein [Flavobacteriales bacterium]|nr:OmpH family outer membrane protein [Flavobacteriales bacterium]